MKKELEVLLCVVLCAILIAVSGCAHRPGIMKQNKDCVAAKVEKMATAYLCLELGGDVRERIP